MAGNPWLVHLKAYYAKNKSSGMSYATAMKEAKKTYRKGKSADAAPKKKARAKRKRK